MDQHALWYGACPQPRQVRSTGSRPGTCRLSCRTRELDLDLPGSATIHVLADGHVESSHLPGGLAAFPAPPSVLSCVTPRLVPGSGKDPRSELPFQRPNVFRGREPDFHVVVDNPLSRNPPGCDPQRVANLLGDDNFAPLSYHVQHGTAGCPIITHHYIARFAMITAAGSRASVTRRGGAVDHQVYNLHYMGAGETCSRSR